MVLAAILQITGTSSWVTTRAVGIPYQTLDGAWRLRFNIAGTSSSVASVSLTFTDATFKTGYDQACSAAHNKAGGADAGAVRRACRLSGTAARGHGVLGRNSGPPPRRADSPGGVKRAPAC